MQIPPKPAPLSEDEVRRQAAAEGLTLVPGQSATGFKGVSVNGSNFQAKVTKGSCSHSLGTFPNALEAALCFARHLGPVASAEVAEASRPSPTLGERPAGAALPGGAARQSSPPLKRRAIAPSPLDPLLVDAHGSEWCASPPLPRSVKLGFPVPSKQLESACVCWV